MMLFILSNNICVIINYLTIMQCVDGCLYMLFFHVLHNGLWQLSCSICLFLILLFPG